MAKSSKQRGAKRAAKAPAAKHARGSTGENSSPRGAAGENSAARDAAAQATQEHACADASAAATENSSSARPARREHLDAREIAEEVFAMKDPVTVAVELLGNETAPKNASVKARVWEKLLEYRFGRPAAMSDSGEDGAPLIVLDLPRPDREYEDA